MSRPPPKRTPSLDLNGKPELPRPMRNPPSTPPPQPTLYQKYKESAMRESITYWLDVILDILCGERTKPKRKRKRKSEEWYYVDDAETIPQRPELVE